MRCACGTGKKQTRRLGHPENPAACEPSVLCSEYSEAGEGSRALLHATRGPNCEDALLGLGTWAYQKLFKNGMNFKIFLKVKKKVQRLAK